VKHLYAASPLDVCHIGATKLPSTSRIQSSRDIGESLNRRGVSPAHFLSPPYTDPVVAQNRYNTSSHKKGFLLLAAFDAACTSKASKKSFSPIWGISRLTASVSTSLAMFIRSLYLPAASSQGALVSRLNLRRGQGKPPSRSFPVLPSACVRDTEVASSNQSSRSRRRGVSCQQLTPLCFPDQPADQRTSCHTSPHDA
jgi:hypothetical protein